MNKIMILAAAITILSFFGQPVVAQELSAPESPAEQNPFDATITVEGIRIAREVNRLARDLTRRPRSGYPLPRFYEPVCIGIAGARPDFAYTLIGRMEDNARAFGVQIANEGCKPNILIAFVENSQRAIRDLRKDQPNIFGNLLPYEVRQGLKQGRPAVAWHATERRQPDGRAFFRSRSIRGTSIELPFEVEQNDIGSGSRIELAFRDDMAVAVVLIEKSAIYGKTIQQLADYATMRALASTQMSEDVPGPLTILSLFEEDTDSPDGLTEFDRAYLAGLYDSSPTARPGTTFSSVANHYRRSQEE